MYAYLKERIKHAVRFRHKRGFGVHSPFVFDLIMNVIRDRDKVYRYPEVEKLLRFKHRERKLYRLLFRLIDYLNAEYVLCLSSRAEKLSVYLSQEAGDVKVFTNDTGRIAEADFIYIGNDARTVLQGELPCWLPGAGGRRRCIIITDIYKNGFNAQLWRQLRGKANVSVDMMWYGVLFFDEKLQKGRYNLTI